MVATIDPVQFVKGAIAMKRDGQDIFGLIVRNTEMATTDAFDGADVWVPYPMRLWT